MNVLPMPPGAQAKAHYHEGIETIAYLLEGRCTVRYGQRLEHRVELSAGEQGFVPADLPHAPCNDSDAPRVWLVVHSSGSDQDGIVMLPELDAILASEVASQRTQTGSPEASALVGIGIFADRGLPVKPALGIVRQAWSGALRPAGWPYRLIQLHRVSC
jgi:uncharacterized cupin superfamily protein